MHICVRLHTKAGANTCTPALAVTVACNGADRLAGPRCLMQARMGTPRPPAHLVPACVTNTPPQINQASNHTRGVREEAQRGTCRPGTLCLRAPFAKLRPPAESPRSALSNHHCLMAHCHALVSHRKKQIILHTVLPNFVCAPASAAARAAASWGRALPGEHLSAHRSGALTPALPPQAQGCPWPPGPSLCLAKRSRRSSSKASATTERWRLFTSKL